MAKSADIKEPKEESNTSHETVKTKDRKDKGNLPPSKIVIRRLPPTMTKEQFLEQISPVPDHNYFNYVAADYSLNQFSFCTAYINFIKQEDIFIFRDKFDNYVFLDAKGNEYAAVVEFAPFQKIPKKKGWKDQRCGTIEQDADYKAFLESLQNPTNVCLPTIDSYLEEIEAKEKELKANHGVPFVKTPLLEYVKQRKIEKQRIRDEKREERRRRENERRKQREEERKRRKYERERQMKEKNVKKGNENTKDYKSDNSDSDTVVKVLKNPGRKPEDRVASENSEKLKKTDKGSSRQFENKNFDTRKEKISKKKPDKPHFKDDEEKGSKGNKTEPIKKKTKNKPISVEPKTCEKNKSKQKPSKSDKEEQVECKINSKKDLKSNDLNKIKNEEVDDGVFPPTEVVDVQICEDSKRSKISDIDASENSDMIEADINNSCSKTDEETESTSNSSKDKSESIIEESSELTEKDIKKEKRIKNKDRPSMELYRPGMRRLAKHSSSSSPQKEISPNSSSSPSPTLQMNKLAKVKPKLEDNSEELEKQ